MLNKKGLSPLILEIIGGVIVVAIILVVFGGFASPFLEFLVDSKSLEGFNKFTNAMTRTCREGSETVPYLELGYQSERKIYAISIIGPNTTTGIKKLPLCPVDNKACATQRSKDKISKCGSSMLCWCLLKITYNKVNTDSNSKYCANWSLNGVSVDNSDIENVFTKWDDKLRPVITSDKIEKVDVLICSDVQKDINCNTTKTGTTTDIPVLPRDGKDGGYIVWIQSSIYKGDWGLEAEDLKFDSISFDRPLSGDAFADYMIFTSNPNITISQKDDGEPGVWAQDCPGAG